MRTCYARSPLTTPGMWRLWRAKHWHVYRTIDATAAVPEGAVEIYRDWELPVSDAEIQRVVSGEAQFGEPIEAECAADVVRGLRHDPGTHDWHAWMAPIHLTAEEAADLYADAMMRPKTIHAHIVLRPCHSARGWFAWIGLGTLIDAILKPNLSARWKTRDDALAAAYSAIAEARRECMAEIERLLDGWDPEAIDHIREGRVPVAFGVVPWSRVIYVHEGDSAGTSSWDLPVVERLDGAAAIRRVKARRESECDRAERRAALRARKSERNRRNKGTIASWLRRAGYVRDGGEVDILKAAADLGIDQKNLRQYLAGEISPSIETLERIAKAIGWQVRVSFEPGQ
jgi:hypothetical protein